MHPHGVGPDVPRCSNVKPVLYVGRLYPVERQRATRGSFDFFCNMLKSLDTARTITIDARTPTVIHHPGPWRPKRIHENRNSVEKSRALLDPAPP